MKSRRRGKAVQDRTTATNKALFVHTLGLSPWPLAAFEPLRAASWGVGCARKAKMRPGAGPRETVATRAGVRERTVGVGLTVQGPEKTIGPRLVPQLLSTTRPPHRGCRARQAGWTQTRRTGFADSEAPAPRTSAAPPPVLWRGVPLLQGILRAQGACCSTAGARLDTAQPTPRGQTGLRRPTYILLFWSGSLPLKMNASAPGLGPTELKRKGGFG